MYYYNINEKTKAIPENLKLISGNHFADDKSGTSFDAYARWMCEGEDNDTIDFPTHKCTKWLHFLLLFPNVPSLSILIIVRL